MLKKVISGVVSVACLMSMTSAFAASTYTGTTTTYLGVDENNVEKIKVETTVNLGAGETATYLVYNDNDGTTTLENLTGTDIIYVDQYKNSTDAAVDKKFSYVTRASNVTEPIKVGADVTDADTIPELAYTVKAGDTIYWAASELPTAGLDSLVAFELTGLTAGDVVASVTVNGVAATDWFTSDAAQKTLWISSADFAEETEADIEITLASAYATTASIKGTAYFAANGTVDEDDADENPSVIVVGNVAGKAKEFGIALGATAEDAAANAQADAADDSVGRLPAYGKNADGDFAVRVYDSNFGETVYAVVYYMNEAGTIVTTAAQQIAIQ